MGGEVLHVWDGGEVTGKISIKIDWPTPNGEDAQKQAEIVEQLILAGSDGIPVVTFSGDAPASKRFVALGIDDFKCGEHGFWAVFEFLVLG